MNIKSLIKSVIEPVVSTYNNWVHRNPVHYTYQDLSVNVLPGVYSPKMHSSTRLFLTYLESINFEGKTVLELGCGSGLLSAYCASKGAMVTASDINDEALKELAVRSRDENWDIISVYSDLFENLHFHFDYILINPPVLPEIKNKSSHNGNYAGQNFEYFDQLFGQLRVRTLRETEVLLFLPEKAELFPVCRRSKQHHLTLKTLKVMRQGLESGTVYRVVELA